MTALKIPVMEQVGRMLSLQIRQGIGYHDLMELINMIILMQRNPDILVCLDGIIEESTSLTDTQKKYIIKKISGYWSEYYNALEFGRIFVWSLGPEHKTYKSCLNTLRYIRIVKSPEKKCYLARKLYVSLTHYPSACKSISINRKNCIIHELLYILAKYDVRR